MCFIIFAGISYWGLRILNEVSENDLAIIEDQKSSNRLSNNLNENMFLLSNGIVQFRETGNSENITNSLSVLGTINSALEDVRFNDDISEGKYREFKKLFSEAYREMVIDLNKMKKESNPAEIFTLYEQLTGNITSLQNSGSSFFESVSMAQDEKQEQNLVYAKEMKSKLLLFQIIALNLLVVLFVIPLIVVSRASGAILKAIKQLSSGDLSSEIKVLSKDEFGQILGGIAQLQLKLKELVGGLSETINSILNASSEFSSGAQTISTGANSQAASSEEISAAMEQIADVFKQSTDNATETNLIAESAFHGIQTGAGHVDTTLSVIEDIALKNSIIREISYQTKILSINASVEAARASEFGRGFAVVADEVKKLAESTQDSADEIGKVSKEGVEFARKTAEELRGLVNEFQKTSELINQIAEASKEHILTIEQINSSIQEFNKVTQQNASSAEELAASSSDLILLVENMNQLISFFKIDGKNEEDSDSATKNETEEIEQEETEILPDETDGFIAS
ncbi:MAG: hypothetical protein JW798_12560, partial [Prolixibacteraceae bacterium]|nr:hypothetical protein [Prolixibacteraceae bacterium]